MEFRISKTTVFGEICALFLVSIITLLINPSSLGGFYYFLLLWTLFFLIVDRKEINTFFVAFFFNAVLTSIYFVFQTIVYPDSYGLTSHHGSWTDDTYFFVQLADNIPSNLFLDRDNFFLYTAFYSDLINFLTFFKVNHPLDVIYFQSGVTAVGAIYTKQFTEQISGNTDAGHLAFWLVLVSPFLLMHGGAILIRDTFVAGMFMMSLSFLNRGRYLMTALITVLQFSVRSGTAIIILILYGFLFYKPIKKYIVRYKVASMFIFFLTLVIVILMKDYLYSYFEELFLDKGLELAGRTLYEDLVDVKGENTIFLFIQNQNIFIKGILSACYMFLYPFFSIKGVVNEFGIDLRSFLIAIVYPIYSIWLNMNFFAFAASKKIIAERNRYLLPYLAGLFIIGLYSLQTRHKTFLLPMFYCFVAIGFLEGEARYKKVGLVIFFCWYLIQFYLAISRI